MERIISNVGNGVAYCDRGQSTATIECIISNVGDQADVNDRGQSTTAIECIISNVVDRVWDSDRGQSVTAIECIVPNRGDRIGTSPTGNATRNRKISYRFGVTTPIITKRRSWTSLQSLTTWCNSRKIIGICSMAEKNK